MRLATFRDGGAGRLAIVYGDSAHPICNLVPDVPDAMEELLAGGAAALRRLRQAWATVAPGHGGLADRPGSVPPGAVPLAQLQLDAPVAKPGKVIAIGLNYVDHAAEQDVEPPATPLVFAKFPSAIIGPGQEICWDPEVTNQVDFEVELAVIIGKTARCVSADEALDYVFGYTACNDVSARDLQFADGQWVRGKSLDTFCLGSMGGHAR